jgi:hypothetical protein
MASSTADLIKALGNLKDFISGLKLGSEEAEKAKGIFSDLEGGIESFGKALDNTSTGLTKFSQMSISSSNTLSDMVSVLKSADGAINGFLTSTEKFSGIVGMKSFVGNLTGTIKEVSGIVTGLTDIAVGMVENYDSLDKGTRELTSSQYEYAASLGLNFDQAVKNTSAFQDLIKTNSDFAKSGIYFNSEDFKKGIKALQDAGISMEELGRKSDVAAGGLNNMQAMTMQAKAMGMDISEYSRKIAGMVRENGISIEDSMKLMASSQDIAKDTGLKVDEVTRSLDGATNGFQKMGATMDFARPVLKGFSESIKDVGLGITQAGDLAQDFSKSLLGIVNNPALAYITSMKGGFAGAMGGPGGVLNPSIQMQAMMLSQEPGDQAELAKNLSMGMRETLKSFTGGDIVTVKDAAAGGADMQSRFYAQQQMLGSVFGISDTTTQSRVLEYLSQLEKATAEGNQEQIDKINQQIADATKGNDKTLDLQQKMSIAMNKTVILIQEQLNLEKAKFIAAGGEGDILGLVTRLTTASENLLNDPTNQKSKDEAAAIKEELAKRFGAATAPSPQPPPEVGATGGNGGGSNAPIGTTTVNQGGLTISGSGGSSNVTVNLNVNRAPGTEGVDISVGSVSAGPGQPTKR